MRKTLKENDECDLGEIPSFAIFDHKGNRYQMDNKGQIWKVKLHGDMQERIGEPLAL